MLISQPPITFFKAGAYLANSHSKLRGLGLLALATVSVSFLAVSIAVGQDSEAAGGDDYLKKLAELEIEDLVNQPVTSVSKKEQTVADSAAAVFVLSQEDLRRSGATSIPEALRMVPGVQVSRINSHEWAISARGFNGLFANKLLVLMDGRTVYATLFGGVYWDIQDTLLEDVERIEVIRGPGAALWGANAVNGVINIISKKARDTTGGLVSAVVGNQERGIGSVRYGQDLGNDNFLRLYAKGLKRDDTKIENDGRNYDDWGDERGGFRYDREGDPDNLITVQGDGYHGREEQLSSMPLFVPPYSALGAKNSQFDGSNLLGRWTANQSDRSQTQLQVYFDFVHRDDLLVGQYRRTYDFDFQHSYNFSPNNKLLWGFGYRSNEDSMFARAAEVVPDTLRYEVYNGFVQEELGLVPDTLSLTLGSKVEHNNFSGIEVEPSARLIWRPNSYSSVWAAISRPVRTPSRASDGVLLNLAVVPPDLAKNANLPTLAQLQGSTTLESETLLSYELGYRAQPLSWAGLDVVGYVTDNNRVSSIEQGKPSLAVGNGPAYALLPFTLDDQANARTEGAEVSATAVINSNWTLQAAYTFSHISVGIDPGSTDTVARQAPGENPRNWASLRSLLKLSEETELDAMLRYVDSIPGLAVPSYLDLDVRFGWRFAKQTSLSIVGQNLLHESHLEYASNVFSEPRAEIQRGVLAKVTWEF